MMNPIPAAHAPTTNAPNLSLIHICLMCGLLILKHVRNLSDESVVEQWSENAYYQYFCGMLEFTPAASVMRSASGTI